jgi:hypothetical protein
LELERLALGKTSQAGLFDSADVNEDVVGTTIYLNEAKTFLAIEKFDDSLARTDDLSGHWWAAGATARGTKATSTTAAAAAITAAAISTAAWTAATKITLIGGWRAIAIVAFITETISFVPALASTLAIKTHNFLLAFSSP